MKMKCVKRVLATVMVMTMIMASALTVSASGGSGTSGNSGGNCSSDSSSSSSSSKGGSGAVASVDIKSADAAVTVAGGSVKTTVAGAYSAKGVRGAAVITSVAEIRTALGLKSTQSPYIVVLDTDVKKSHKAMDSINAAVAALGGQYITALNVDLGARELGKFVSLSNGSVNMVVGLPASADTTKTYCVVMVQPGGATTILEDVDLNPNTVTFPVKAGLGTYAIVVK